MSHSKGAAPSHKVAAPIERRAASQQPSFIVQGTGEDASLTTLRAQFPSMRARGGTPDAHVLAAIPRVLWVEVIAQCPGCGQAHRHHLAADETQPALRTVRCGNGRTATYVVHADGAQ